MTTNLQNMTTGEHKKLESIVLAIMRHVRKTTARTWRIHGEDIRANALERVWYEFARTGESIDLDNPSAKHLRIVAKCCQAAVYNPFAFIDASSLFSARETAKALGVSTGTAHAWRKKLGNQTCDRLVRLAIANN